MSRLALVAVVAACSSRKLADPPPPPTAAQEMRWVDAKGELIVVAKDGRLDGPCGPLGTYDANEVRSKAGPLKLGTIERAGTRYTPSGMNISVDLAPSGDVTEHSPL